MSLIDAAAIVGLAALFIWLLTAWVTQSDLTDALERERRRADVLQAAIATLPADAQERVYVEALRVMAGDGR